MRHGESDVLDALLDQWADFQRELVESMTGLSDEQIAFQGISSQRPLGMIMQHLISARVWWLHMVLGAVDDLQVAEFDAWDAHDAPLRSAPELVRGLEKTWDLIQWCFDHWTESDLTVTVNHEYDGKPTDLSRIWLLTHILEHDFMHGGEVAILLGIQGLPAPKM